MAPSPRPSKAEAMLRPPKRTSLAFQQIKNKVWLANESAFFLQTCRLFGFILMYMYHDFQSIPMFVWFCHSTLYKRSVNFKRAIIFAYLPILTVVFLWYYLVNITDLVGWPDREDPDWR